MRGWSASGDLVTGQGINGGLKQINLQARLEHEDSLTTQFNISGIAASCRAEIVSLLGGNSVRRVVSVIDGMSVTTRGKNISVSVRDFTHPGTSNGKTYQVAILSSLGVRASSGQPPMLAPLIYNVVFNDGIDLPIQGSINVPPASEYFVPIPSDCGVNSVFVSVYTPGIPDVNDFSANQRNDGSVILSSYDPTAVRGWVPVQPNAFAIGLSNIDAALTAQFAVTFGIDG
jgi:hypothetical protein